MSKKPSEFERGVIVAMPMLRSVARGMCKNPDLAGDLVQEVVTRALEHRHQFVGGSNLDAWLVTILKNYYRSTLRKMSTRMELCDTDALQKMEVPVLSSDPVDVITAKELIRSIDMLPIEFREPLLLIAIDGASYEEAAVECVAHIGTIKSRINRGRRMLTTTVLEGANR